MIGLDVSHWQRPSDLDWALLRDAHDVRFAWVRATYGVRPDRAAVEHVHRARAAGIVVGLYHFLRPSEPVRDQLRAFGDVALACEIEPGDLLPALDIEAHVGLAVTPAWEPIAREVSDTLAGAYSGCVTYINGSDFIRLGKPSWLTDRPLWIASYRTPPRPGEPLLAPSDAWLIHQYAVAPGPHGKLLDWNMCRGELPVIVEAML